MGYAVYNLRGNYGRKSDAMEFEEAAMMVEEGLECMRELAEEMKAQYGGRGGYGMRRGGYGNRYYGMRDWEEDEMMDERRRRDSRGRYM